jgi:serine protease Do
MHRWVRFLFLMVCFLGKDSWPSTQLYTTTIADIAEAAKDSVINVASLNLASDDDEKAHRMRNLLLDPKKDLFGTEMLNAPRRMGAIGSGFIIKKEEACSKNIYYVVTNNHVIEGTISMRVILADESIHHATLVGRDPDTDVAVLKFETEKKLKALEWGDSEKLRVGEWSIVLGNPYGLGGTSLTTGVISYLARDLTATGKRTLVDNYIQTEAAINPGNSGGPLLGLDGKVIGVNTSIITTSGSNHSVGFAVPGALAKSVVEKLLLTGKAKRAWLGTQAQAVNGHLAKCFGLQNTNGALITKVIKGSPAEQAGIQVGDVVISINGKPVKKFADLNIIGKQLTVGEKATFGIIRCGKALDVHPVMQAYQDHEDFQDSLRFDHIVLEDHVRNDFLGFGVTSLTSQLRQRFEINDPSVDGILISDVQEESIAEQFTFMQGDIILAINGERIHSIQALNPLIEKAVQNTPEKPILFLLHREGSHNFFIAVDPKTENLRNRKILKQIDPHKKP